MAWGFAGSGIWLLARRRATRFGLLSTATGACLFVTCWVFSDAPLPYTIGVLLGLLWLAPFVHLILAFPSGRLTRVECWMVACSYLTVTVLHALPIAFWAGDFGPVCDECPRNLALIEPNRELARALLTAYAAFSIALTLVTVAYIVRFRWLGAGAQQ